MKKVLLLPCNKGAVVGDYYRSPIWRYARRLLEEEGLRARVALAAIDSIITLYDPAGDRASLGAVVLEWEAWRVKGHDVRPDLSKFTRNKDLYSRLVRDIATGIKRLRRDGFSEIYATLWVAAYQAATHDALLRLGRGTWPHWATMILIPPSPLSARRGIRCAVQAMKAGLRGLRILPGRYAEAWRSFWSRRAPQLNTNITYDLTINQF